MRLGIVCYPTYGGSGVVATELGKALATKGHEVHFITYRQPTRLDFLSSNLHYHEVDIRSYPLFEYPPYELALASKVVEVVKQEELDILHVHYAIPHASAAYMARQILKEENITIPFITTLHGTDITLVGKEPAYEPVVNFSINQSDGITAVSADLRNDTLEHFNIKKDIKVISNFIDLNRFKKQKKDHFKSAICLHGEKLIVHTSNFRRVKRIDDVINIFDRIQKETPAKLLLVGDGPERTKAEEQVKDLAMQNDVRFLGKIDAIEEVLSLADLFLMPSEKESFGLAALEAMACQVPVIASRAGGIPELVKDGFSGFLAEIGDVETMAKRALQVLDDDHLSTFKQQALARAQDFDLSRILPQYENYYHEVLAKTEKPA